METNNQKVSLTNKQVIYLYNLILKINRKLGLLKDGASNEDGMTGGIKGLLFLIQGNLTYPTSEKFITDKDGEIEVLQSTVEFSNEEIFFIIKILEDELFKNKKISKKIVPKMIQKFKKIEPQFIVE